MQLPELGSVNFKICTKITGDSFPQRKILSALSQKELFPCRFSAPPPPRLLVPSSLCSAFSHVCMNILHSQFLFLWQRHDASELSARLAFQRHYITCKADCLQLSLSQTWSILVQPSCLGVWISLADQSPKAAGSLSKMLISSPDLEQNTDVWLKPWFSSSRGESGTVWWCPPIMGCALTEVCSPREMGYCWSSSVLLPLVLEGCHCYSSQEELNMMLVCNSLPSQCCRWPRSGSDVFRLVL